MRTLIAAVALAGAVACAGPTTVVRTVDTRPAIAVVGAPAGSTLYLDGLPVGDPAAYDGNPGVLRVEPGTHVVEVRVDGRPAFTQSVFVEGELKTVKVH
ncbi:MAG TPA: hypothetical protein VFP50_17960 [Anaeromyxobacteraceae bacterium]|nr:hypothetical protein [Anaeromyxobacteraceae bacterium]